jgi:thioredoxin 1
MSIIDFDYDSLHGKLEDTDKPVFVDFWASWCGPCKMQSSVLETVSENNEDVVFGKVNIDCEDKLAEEYSIMSIPTLILFKNGVAVKKLVGLHSVGEIQETLDEYK